MAKITNEKGVKAEVKKLFDKHGWFWFMPPANGYGKGGISDFLAIKSGVFLAVETKFGTNKPSALQVGFLESIRSEMGYGFVVNEKNLPWLDRFLECFNNAVEGVIASGGKGDPADAIAHEDGADLINALAALTELA